MGWRGRREGGLGWGTHVNPWLIHVNVWHIITLELGHQYRVIYYIHFLSVTSLQKGLFSYF